MDAVLNVSTDAPQAGRAKASAVGRTVVVSRSKLRFTIHRHCFELRDQRDRYEHVGRTWLFSLLFALALIAVLFFARRYQTFAFL